MSTDSVCAYCHIENGSPAKPLVKNQVTVAKDGFKQTIEDVIQIEKDMRYSYSLNDNNHILTTRRKTQRFENDQQTTPVFETKETAINIIACPKCGRKLNNVTQ